MAENSAGAGVRRANLSALLRLVHLDGPVSRAALTRTTGLNRSTIADLVGQLCNAGLVVERDPDPTMSAGRPSNLVVAHPGVVALAANPEVDAVTIAAVGLDRGIRIHERIEVAEPPTPERASRIIADTVARWREEPLRDSTVCGIGLAVPGLVRADDGMVRSAPHLEWTDAAIGDVVATATGLPVTVGNDASLGAVAEHRFGAARGHRDVIYLNGGASGIGGGLIVDGRPVGGAGGYAGEFGQNRPGIMAPADRRADGGVLEDEVSRARLLREVGLSSADEPTLADALDRASSTAAAELDRQRRILATALANAINVLNPTVVVLGGFLATLAERDLAGLHALVAGQTMAAAMEDVELRAAVLGEDRLLVGAAEAAFEAVLSDPTVFRIGDAAHDH